MAEIYGTLAGALQYHADRGNGAWAAVGVTDQQRTAALVRGSEGLDGQYGARFPGVKAGGRTQAREWPREGAEDACTGETIPNDEEPEQVEWAAYEMALAELVTPGASSPTFVAGEQFKRERVEGVVEVERFAQADDLASMVPVLAAVERHLRCLLTADQSTAGTSWVLRA